MGGQPFITFPPTPGVSAGDGIDLDADGVISVDRHADGGIGLVGGELVVQAPILIPYSHQASINSATFMFYGDTQMSANIGFPILRAGTLVSNAVRMNITSLSGLGSLGVEVLVNGVADSTLQITIASTAGTGFSSFSNKKFKSTGIDVVAGDWVSVRIAAVSGSPTWAFQEIVGWLALVENDPSA